MSDETRPHFAEGVYGHAEKPPYADPTPMPGPVSDEVELQWEHEHLVGAFVAALAELTVIEKAHTAAAGTYSYSYADLGDLVKLTRPVLAKHGLAAVTPVHGHGDGLAVTVTLYHDSGDSLAFDPLTFPHGKDAQTTGSWITYMRRYALLAALGMAAGDDDDGARAVEGQSIISGMKGYVERDQARRTPGLRTSVLDAIAKLTEAERTKLRAWCEEQGIPIVPKEMTEDQCTAVIGRIMEITRPADWYGQEA